MRKNGKKSVPQSFLKKGVLWLLLCAGCFRVGWGEVVDRILAVVEDDIVTLTDVRIADAFELVDVEEGLSGPEREKAVLREIVDRKLVIRFTGDGITLEEDQLEASLQDLIQRMEPRKAEENLLRFGLDWDDLKSYLEEKLLFERIVAQKFERGIMVSLEEMETHYEKRVVPETRRKGLEPEPMMEILDELETSLRREKIKSRLREWIDNLEQKADVRWLIE